MTSEASEPDWAPGSPGEARPTCPICGRPAQAAPRPFCSKRGRDLDSDRWLSGSCGRPGSRRRG
ncbi:MAG TPA: DNA gyrase inhibitor YacG [Bradyrhizobium sp.]|nr:DNA gyrase inhibitor YacG [Bradyrhizobium sp.]